MGNQYFVFMIPNENPFYIKYYGSQKMIIDHAGTNIKIVSNRGFNRTKSEIMSQISHFFNLPYIKKYNSKCMILEINPEDYIEKEN